ncbi:universal stress protein [Peptococcaceae bacterium]|nr:universal stress protein [Peptococcaceae bacterium]MCL0052382.1 universal stress protein [Peptococcaceae bacterium]
MYKKILTPLDGSELAECTLKHIEAIANGCKVSEIILLTILEKSHFQLPGLSGRERQELQQKNEAWAKDYLASVSKKLNVNGNTKIEAVIRWGNPADEILNYVSENNIDLVIMSTRGLTGISRWTFGSIAEKVMRRSAAPVLIISPVTLKIK